MGLGYTGEGFSLGAGLSLDEFDEWLSMPHITYLGLDDLKDLAEYLTAAVNTAESRSVTLSTREPISTDAGDISVTLQFLRGEEFPIKIDTENKTVTVSPEIALHLTVQVAHDKLPLTVDAWILDGDEDGDEDNVLDFYVSATRKDTQSKDYKPLVVKASADELMPLIASALPLLGIDSDLANDYFVGKWVDSMTAERLSVIGDSLLDTLDFFGVFDELFGGAAGGTASDELIAAVVKGDDTFSLTLGGGALGMGSDLVLGLEKTATEEGEPLLKAVSLAIGSTGLTFDINYGKTEIKEPTFTVGQQYELDGMAELFTALANTATHKGENGEYVLNETYLMSGSARLSIGKYDAITIDINALAVSILENGDIALDARISYNDFLGITASQVDLSIRGSMIYMMRTSGSEVLYRAMPLSVFGATLKDQLVFLLHMSNLLAWMIPDDIGGGMSDEGGDLGAQAANILSSYDFKEAGSEDGVTADQWLLTLNGEAITGGVLSDIGVTLNEGNGLISSLNVTSSLIDILTLSADLSLKNGGESWATEIDYNKTLSYYLANGMDAAIENNKANGWSTYLEGTEATVTYVYPDKTTSVQKVFCDNGGELMTSRKDPVIDDATKQAFAEKGYDFTDWGELTRSEGGWTVQAVYEAFPITVTIYDGFGYSTDVEIPAGQMPETPVKAGYTFLGWWRSDESGEWEKVNSLSYSGGQEITLHALWVKAELDAECNVVSDGGWFKDSTYEAKGTVSIEFKGCDVYQDAEIAITSATLKMNKVFGSDSYSYREIIDDEVSFDFLKGKYYSWNMSVNVKITIGKEVFELNQVTDNGSF